MTSCPFLAAQGVPASVLDCLLQECLLHGHAPNTDWVVTKSEKEQNISRKVCWKPTIELPTYRNGTRVCTRKTSGCSTSGFNQTVCYCCSEHSLQICSNFTLSWNFGIAIRVSKIKTTQHGRKSSVHGTCFTAEDIIDKCI